MSQESKPLMSADYGVKFGPHRVSIPWRGGYRTVTWEHTEWPYLLLYPPMCRS